MPGEKNLGHIMVVNTTINTKSYYISILEPCSYSYHEHMYSGEFTKLSAWKYSVLIPYVAIICSLVRTHELCHDQLLS
jgi:hypothetical protein